MAKFNISNTLSGTSMGVFEGETEQEALDNYARDAGYADFAAACELAPVTEGEILVMRQRLQATAPTLHPADTSAVPTGTASDPAP